MADALSQLWPWAGRRKTESATSEGTQGKLEETRWIIVGVHLNPAEAAIIKGRLESEDIPAFVQQEAMGSLLGLTVGPMGSAKVLVPEPLVEKALKILEETFELDESDEFDEDDAE